MYFNSHFLLFPQCCRLKSVCWIQSLPTSRWPMSHHSSQMLNWQKDRQTLSATTTWKTSCLRLLLQKRENQGAQSRTSINWGQCLQVRLAWASHWPEVRITYLYPLGASVVRGVSMPGHAGVLSGGVVERSDSKVSDFFPDVGYVFLWCDFWAQLVNLYYIFLG